MKTSLIELATIAIIFLNQISFGKSNREDSDISISDIYKSLKQSIASTLNNTLYNSSTTLSQDCARTIDSIYIQETSSTNNETKPIDQLILHSTKNKNDAMTFEKCKRYSNTKYLIFQLKENSNLSDIHLDSNKYIFALCLDKNINCTFKDYKTIISFISHTTHGLIEPTAEDDIQVLQLKNSKSEWFEWIYLLSFIPLLIVLIQLVFVVFNKLPYLLFIRCLRVPEYKPKKDSRPTSLIISMTETTTNNNSNKVASRRISFQHTKYFIEIENAFSVTENSDEIIKYEAMASKINNESGLIYIKGLRGIALMLLAIGQVFVILWKSPAYIYSLQLFDQTVRSLRFGLVFFGLRYSPAILFSCSGFILIFKFMCFLDDKIEEICFEEKDQKALESSRESLKSGSDATSMNDSRDSLILLNSTLTIKKKKPRLSAVLTFFLYQIHKYFIMILLVFFIKFSLYYFKIVLTSVTPYWEYLYQSSIQSMNSLFLDIVLQLFCINNFLFKNNPESADILEVFWIVNNEIIFFLISTIAIFVFYRIKKSINIFVIVFGLFLLVIRFIIVFTMKHYYSTMYYTADHFGKFFHNPIYNYPSYLIGIYFGLINYVIQKGMTIKNAKDEKKIYLINVIVNAKLMLKQSNRVTFISAIVIFVVVVIFSISQPLFLYGFDSYVDFIRNIGINIFYLVDIEIIVFFIHYVFFMLFIKGENALTNMISANFWSIPHKMYYSIILMNTSVIYFMFYQSESRIMLGMTTIVYYSAIIWCLVIIVAFVLFIMFEMPYKRIIRFLTHMHKISNEFNDVNENQEVGEDNTINMHYNE